MEPIVLQVGDTLTYFLSQGKPVLRKNKSSEIRDSEEEETSEEISDSALIASSVLAKYLSIAPNKVGADHTQYFPYFIIIIPFQGDACCPDSSQN